MPRAAYWTAVCRHCGTGYGPDHEEREEAETFERETDEVCADCCPDPEEA